MKITKYVEYYDDFKFNILGIIATLGVNNNKSYYKFDDTYLTISVFTDMYVITYKDAFMCYIFKDNSNPRHRQVLYDFESSFCKKDEYDYEYMRPNSLIKIGTLDFLVVKGDVTIGEFYGIPVMAERDAYDTYIK